MQFSTFRSQHAVAMLRESANLCYFGNPLALQAQSPVDSWHNIGPAEFKQKISQ